MTQSSGAPVTGEALPRFFLDHTMIHDRLTGCHVEINPQYGGTDALTLLNELHALAQPHRSEPDQGRARFEDVMRKEGVSTIFPRVGGVGDYCSNIVDIAWRAWQASEQRSAVGEPVAWQWGVDIGAPSLFWDQPIQHRGSFEDSIAQARASWAGREVIERKLYAVPTASGDARDEVARWVHDEGRVCVSHVQRRLRIGYNRAQRICDELEAGGVIVRHVGLTYVAAHAPRVSPVAARQDDAVKRAVEIIEEMISHRTVYSSAEPSPFAFLRDNYKAETENMREAVVRLKAYGADRAQAVALGAPTRCQQCESSLFVGRATGDLKYLLAVHGTNEATDALKARLAATPTASLRQGEALDEATQSAFVRALVHVEEMRETLGPHLSDETIVSLVTDICYHEWNPTLPAPPIATERTR